MSETIATDLKDGVLNVALNRPDKRNALSNGLFFDLVKVLESAAQNPAVRVLLLTGAGKDFSVGADFKDAAGRSPKEEPGYRVCERVLVALDKPLIGAVRGFAVGGGATIPLHCDILYVGESLKMRFPFVSLGIVPEFASSHLLPMRVGHQRAAEFIFTSAWIDADLAVESGIAYAKLPDEEVEARAMEKAVEIAQGPLNSLRATKRCLLAARQQSVSAALEIEGESMGKQAGSPENMEAVMAFLQKRKPDFGKLG